MLPYIDPCPPRHRKKENGFSLAEIVLALGIIGFALTGILALMPVAMKASQESQNETQAILISRKIFADLKASANGTKALLVTGPDFPSKTKSINLQKDSTNIIGYDYSGNPIGSIAPSAFSNAIPLDDWIYAVELSVNTNTQLPYLSRVETLVTFPAAAPFTNRQHFSFSTLLDSRDSR